MGDWIDCTTFSSAYEQQYSPGTDQWQHRPRTNFMLRGLRGPEWSLSEPVIEGGWRLGPAPDQERGVICH